MTRRLLWIGDAAVSTGFARVTHRVLDVLRRSWDVYVLGLNYIGDPHAWPYPIYPAHVAGDPHGDGFGLSRTAELVEALRPDCVVVLNDPWNVPYYMRRISSDREGTMTVAMVAVDGKNCKGHGLNGLALALFWTQFGMDEARAGGYAGPAAVVPLGVDLDLYKPMPRAEARWRRGLPERYRDAYIVGNVNRNQPRKRLDLTISFFAEWVRECRVDDAYLYLHVAPTGDRGYDPKNLMKYYGIGNRLILAEPEIGHGDPEHSMPATYGCFDVQVTTTQGEGFGLTTLEGMACGVPQIVPSWAALGDWCGDAAVQVPCAEIAVTPDKINAIGAVPDRRQFVAALDALYRSEALRAAHRERGLALAARPEYRWEAVGELFAQALDEALEIRLDPRPAAMEVVDDQVPV